MREILQPVWQFEYSVECQAPADFAWKYWTNIANWSDPPAEFEINGPFAPGSQVTTRIPGQEPLHSTIRDVVPGRAATIEMQLPGAILRFRWRFDDSSTSERARLTQRLTLEGEQATPLIEHVSIFERTVPDGMNKIAAAISKAHVDETNRLSNPNVAG